MAFTAEQRQRIAQALNTKGLKPCPSCGKVGTFSIGDSLVRIVLQDDPKTISLGGRSYPCVPVLCSYCGYMLFYNVYTLGIAPLLGLEPGSAKEAGTNG